MPKDQKAPNGGPRTDHGQLEVWQRRFRAAVSKWSGMIPRGVTVSTAGSPKYYAQVPRANATQSGVPENEAEWKQLGWTFKDVQSEDGTVVRVKSARPEPNRTSPLAKAAMDLAETCRAFTSEEEGALHLSLIRLKTALEELADELEADPDPATVEQRQGVREVERLLAKTTLFQNRIAEEGITELELVRLDRKRKRVENNCSSLPELHSLWQETTDLLTRTNLHESSRTEELSNLQVIAWRLAATAQGQAMPRAALQALRGRLRMLMPREWFHDPETKKQVIDDICRANVEVEELAQASTAPTEAQPTEATNPQSLAASASPESLTREAFHRAVMAVYADVGKLVGVLRKAPDLDEALLLLDGIGGHSAPEPGEPPLVTDLKHSVGHLMESLNTVEDVRKSFPRVRSAFGRGREIDRTWGSIAARSYHDVIVCSAHALLEPDAAGAAQLGLEPSPGRASGIIRRGVIETAVDSRSWTHLAENLKHEHDSASLLPPTRQPDPAQRASDPCPAEASDGGDPKAPQEHSYGNRLVNSPALGGEHTAQATADVDAENPADPQVESSQHKPTWTELTPKHQAALCWLLTRKRGDAFTRTKILTDAPHLHDKGADRRVLQQLAASGFLGSPPGTRDLRLERLPEGVPEDLERHSSWSS